MAQLTTIQQICIWALPVLFAITVHEVAHGWIANKCGDPTARMLGRLTLNPLKHIDLIGTIVVPIILLFFSGFIFGWAKPVPITWQNLRRPRLDMALVAIAGPLANLFMALFWAMICKLGLYAQHNSWPGAIGIFLMGDAGIQINIVLMVLNLLPIPPLDGSRVISAILSPKIAFKYNRIEIIGFFLLLLLLAFGVLSAIVMPPVTWIYKLITSLFHLF